VKQAAKPLETLKPFKQAAEPRETLKPLNLLKP
jgi:hypothetical protein